jgi:hypothetical protein
VVYRKSLHMQHLVPPLPRSGQTCNTHYAPNDSFPSRPFDLDAYSPCMQSNLTISALDSYIDLNRSEPPTCAITTHGCPVHREDFDLSPFLQSHRVVYNDGASSFGEFGPTDVACRILAVYYRWFGH